MTAVLPLVPLYLQQIGVDDRDTLRYWTGAISAASFVVAAFATPVWGALADRIGHKPMVVRSVLGIALASTGMGFADEPWELLAWRGVQGAVSGVFPAAVALITSLTPEVRVGRSLAILQATRSAGVLCGPLLGGLLADTLGIRPLFFGVGAIAFSTAIVCSFVLREARVPPGSEHHEEPPRWADLLGERSVLGMLVVVALYQVVSMASWPTLALFVEKLGVEQDAVATVTGLVVFAQGLPSMLVATTWASGVPRFGLTKLLGWSILGAGVLNVAVGAVGTIESVLVLRLVGGVAMAGFVPLSFQWLNGFAPPQARGRMAGISSTAMMIGNVVGSLFGSWLAVEVSLAATFWVPGLLLMGTGVLFMLLTRPRR